MSAWFWTAADQAELDVLLWALVSGYFEHRRRCATCAAGFPPCQHLQAAIEALHWAQAAAAGEGRGGEAAA